MESGVRLIHSASGLDGPTDDVSVAMNDGHNEVPPYNHVGDYHDVVAEWKDSFTICLSVTMGMFILLAIIGNLLVIIVVVKNRGMRTRTNIFLCNLAFVDFITGVVVMPVAMVTVINKRWVLSETMCQINGFLVAVCIVCSIHTLMYIALHKYLTITRPFSTITKKRTFLMVGAAWIWAVVIGYLNVHGMTRVTYKPNTSQCDPVYPNTTLSYVHTAIFDVTCYVIPFSLMVFCYVKIFNEIKAASERMIHHTNQELDVVIKQQKRIFLTLLSVLVVFCLCWTPFFAYTVVVAVTKNKHHISDELNPVVYWFGYMNSALNPLIYAWKSPAFRDGYREVVCQQKKTSEEMDPTHGAFHVFRTNLWTWMCQRLSTTFPPLPHYSAQPAEEAVVDVTDHLLHVQRQGSSTSGSLPDDFGLSEDYSDMFVDLLPDLRYCALRDLDLCSRVSFDSYPPLTAYYVPSPKTKRKKKKKPYKESYSEESSSCNRVYLEPGYHHGGKHSKHRMRYIDDESSVSFSDASTDHSIKSILKPSRDGYSLVSNRTMEESAEVYNPPSDVIISRCPTPSIPRIEISEVIDDYEEVKEIISPPVEFQYVPWSNRENGMHHNTTCRIDISDTSLAEPLTGGNEKARKRSAGTLARLFQRIRRGSKRLRPWKSQESVISLEGKSIPQRVRYSTGAPEFQDDFASMQAEVGGSPGYKRSTSHNTLLPPDSHVHKKRDQRKRKAKAKSKSRSSSLKVNIGRPKGHSLPATATNSSVPCLFQRSLSDRPGPRLRFMRLPSIEKLDNQNNFKCERRASRRRRAWRYLGKKRGSLPLRTLVQDTTVEAKLRRCHSDPAISIERLIDLYETRTALKRTRNTIHANIEKLEKLETL